MVIGTFFYWICQIDRIAQHNIGYPVALLDCKQLYAVVPTLLCSPGRAQRAGNPDVRAAL